MLLVMYGISLSEVTSLQQPLAALNMAMHVIYRFSHVRALAFFMCSQVGGDGRWEAVRGGSGEGER